MEKVKKEKKVKTVTKKKSNVKKKNITDLQGNVVKTVGEKKVREKGKIKKHIKKYKKVYLFALMVLIVVLVIILGYIGIRNLILSNKYGKYEKKMNDYGFSLMYNNQTAKSYEKVTRVEMVKLVIASVYNTTDIRSMGFIPTGEFEDDEWVALAKSAEIIDEEYITEENYDEIATYKETLMTYLNARSKLLNMAVSSTTESSFKNLNSFNPEERAYINDAVENGLIEDEKSDLKIDNQLFKGQFNMLVIKFVEKYNTFVPDGETVITKKESKPKNADIYPYILYSVDKEVYEYKGINEGGVDYKTPLETYKYKKDYYEQIDYRAEYYYNLILNVDYKTIEKDEFLKATSEFLRYDYEEEIKKYVDYVKENKIVISGEAKVQFPIFYLDGISYRARIKLTFEIKNSDTDKNLLLGDMDRGQDVTYKNKTYEVYIDAPMGTTMLSKALLLDMEAIIDLMVNDTEASEKNEF